MKKIYLILVAVLMSLSTSAQTVVVVPDISKYTGTEQYVYNEADGKTYVRNNIGAYELYGLYEEVNTLKVKSATGETQVDYLMSTNDAYINLGYIPKKNTKIEAVFEAQKDGDWLALYGNSFQANTRKVNDQDVEFPGTADPTNFSAGNGWKHSLALFPNNGMMNMVNIDINFKEKGELDDSQIFNTKIKTVQDGVTGSLTVYDESDIEIASITDSPLPGDCATPLYVFAVNKHLPVIDGYNDDPNAFGANAGYCYNSKVKLYSLKIYEGSTLKYDLVPVLSDGKGALKDVNSGKFFYNANENGNFVVPEEAGITAYPGKMVIYEDKVYKYNDASEKYEFVSNAQWFPIANNNYQDMNNWVTNNDHMGIFKDKWTKTENGYKIDPYVGTGGHEPLMIKIDSEKGNVYNYSFTSSWGAYNSWHNTEMHAYVCNFWDLGTQESGLEVSGSVLATQTFSFDGGENVPFSLDFVADRDDQTLVFQFGDVDDGKNFWFEFDNLLVQQKKGTEEYTAVNIFGPQIEKLLPEIEEAELNTTDPIQKALDDAVKEAKASLDGNNLAAQQAALEKLQKAFSLAKDVDVTILQKTIAIAKAEGVSTADAEDFIQNGTENKLNSKLNALRVARKVAHMEKDDAKYKGNAPAEADFYIYNVGRKAYLTSGSDWGTHAALGLPGLLATLAENGDGYTIQFQELKEGDARNRFLNGSPYCDGADDAKGTYIFEPVSGKPGVYNIKDSSRGYLAFDPDGDVDGGGLKDFNTVTALWTTPENEDAEWMLVTKEDREAQLDNATAENGVDVSYLIKNASFNKYADLGQWSGINQSNQFGRREFGDKNTEHYHSDEEETTFSLNQEITLPREGWYELTVQAYFRDGDINPYIESVTDETLAAEAGAVLYFGTNAETPLKYIHEEADKAPGEGTDTEIGNIPDGEDGMYQASKFFENGLYVNSLLFKADAADLVGGVIGIDELEVRNGSWIVADNFRLKYYGNGEEPDITGIETVKTDGETTTTASPIIFNLAGQRLSSPRKGINIINGKKIVMK